MATGASVNRSPASSRVVVPVPDQHQQAMLDSGGQGGLTTVDLRRISAQQGSVGEVLEVLFSGQAQHGDVVIVIVMADHQVFLDQLKIHGIHR